MSQLDGIKHTGLQRIELAYSADSYKFNVNPQSIKYEMPHRVSAIKTQKQYVIEDFNDDIWTITISGNTGGPRAGAEDAINRLKDFFNKYNNATPSYGQSPTENLIFYNHTEDFAWEVTPAAEGLTVDRDVQHPLMWDYEMKFIVIRDAGEKAPDAPFANEVSGFVFDAGRYSNDNNGSIYDGVSFSFSGNNSNSYYNDVNPGVTSNNNSNSYYKPTNLSVTTSDNGASIGISDANTASIYKGISGSWSDDNTTSYYNPRYNYADVRTGKQAGTAQASSVTGATRAKGNMGIQ